MSKTENKVNPIRLTDTETGEVYVLEFSRESVRFAEQRGLKISELTEYPQTNIPLFFFCAFRMHHKNVARSKTDAILEEMGGLTVPMLERLTQLYSVPNEALIVVEDDGAKNSKMTVEL